MHYKLFIILLILTLLAGAAQALRFHATMDPMVIDDAQPGQVVTRAFQLTLADDEQRTQFKAKVEDWWRSADGKSSYYKPPGTLAHSCAPWIALNPVESAVNPGGLLEVKVTITIPREVKPGGYWSVLTVDEAPNPLALGTQGVGVRFLASISVGIFVNVTPIHRAAKILAVALQPTQARVTLRNDGDCPLRVDGRVEFLKPGEKTPLATAPLTREVLLPEPIATGVFTADLPDAAALPAGRYLVRAVLDIGLDHYIGVQKEMDFTRETPHPAPAPGK